MKWACGLSILFLLTLVFSSCERRDIDVFTLEGYLTDEVSGKPVPGVHIRIDGLKSPSGMGIITDGKRKTAGQAVTDNTGYFKAKLKVFKAAEQLELFINNNYKEGYAFTKHHISLSGLDRSSKNRVELTLNPTALLKVKFRNANPVSDEDTFRFAYYGSGTGKTSIQGRENCGTVEESEHFTWTGKDVCGIYILEAVAGYETTVYWSVTKNNETKQYHAKVFVERDVLNEFSINY
ncbi:carboxypeptidase regulatory-like domain-containing protein [Pontibacter qinzhouensis]|uniref:Carboxypeptidase regulatory-like domain-containing protein n=1 Tax=Pontibacter qinzhouensis TaxID=2603253 RepID=A0A5C8JI45_9BACT|nr:carboxypeptidase regulatory-like domain-containing protein [Pontibacter qinzhouensis]TXK36663.1 carboxypeptidase regulatory-like domain-containing protein [Pontibacter qinzhouensis]